ncbi:MAG: DUF3276 family protein [Saprospirales bacterium]|nr:MAG: DUF3276 family protein [Saprospirales bacterium]
MKDVDLTNKETVFTTKVKAGKRRTYFFDVRKTKGNDFYITLTESTRRFDGNGYERHKLFLYKEDFNRFIEGLEETIKHVKTELMPDYDYEEFDKRYEDDNDEGSNTNPSSASDKKMDDDQMSW